MHVAELAQLLQERGHCATILTSPGSRLAQRAVQSGLLVHQLAFGGYLQPIAIWRLALLLQAGKFDLVHCHYGRDLWTLVPALKWCHALPMVLTKHIGTQKPKRDPLHRWLYRHVDFLIANSQVIYRNLLNTHPITAGKAGVIHLGIDGRRFYRNPDWRQRARAEFGIGEAEIVFGIAGRLQRWKGHYEFLQMAAALSQRYNQTRFLVIGGASVGEEQEAAAIQSAAVELNLGSKLIFTGFRSDVPRLLNALDVFVFPSYAEAYGLALLEALAVGLPIIATACDGVLDIVRDGETGVLIPPRQSAPLIAAAEKLLLQPELRRRLATAGHEQFKRSFTAARMLTEIEELYSRLVAGAITENSE